MSNNNLSEKLIFQISDYNSYHEIDGENEEKYVMQIFGRTEDDQDVCLKIVEFTPFFYVEIPSNWGKTQVNIFIEALKRKVSWNTKDNANYLGDLSESLVKYELVQKHKFYNFTNKKLFNFIILIFKSHTAMKEFSNALAGPLRAPKLSKEPMIYQRYESNIEPHIRFMHINNLSSCGWVSIDKTSLKQLKDYSYCNHSYAVHWKHVKPYSNDNRMAPFKIMGYDIECISCDHNFPQAERKSDKIIEIGMTMYRYGSMKCYEQHMLTLNACPPIKNTNVECYKTEKGLIRGWAKKMRDIRPDFKVGYNNFGFDDKYIYDRIQRIDQETANKQGISVAELENKFMDEILQIMGKVNNKYLMDCEGLIKSLTYFETRKLSSSALGDNELKFFQVPGIISIDMMKVIQRDHRLVGYKLDNVSANFITEGVIKISENENTDSKTQINIYTKSTKALENNSYIQIMVDDGYSSSPLSENAKYKVTNIETVTEKKINKDGEEETFTFQCIKTEMDTKDVKELREIMTNPLLKVFWTFAKDDMHHTLINKHFKEGNLDGIKSVAKYCIKDCKLVNLLLAKLEIIVNSVGMAEVCHVPLSYLFLRGQGVKIFSLVSKKCREKNYLIPVLRRKKKDTNGDDDESYEGATVITPKPDVYLSPIGVLDFNSLYPNSMREGNLTHECCTNDSKYDNLPGYIYHDVYIELKNKKGKIIRNIDGTPQKEHYRFAQEIMTEEMINEELKEVFNKINNTMNTNIDKIKTQKYFTEGNMQELFDNYKTEIDKKIEDIKNQNLGKNQTEKLIQEETDKLKYSFPYLFALGKIDEIKKKTEERIKKINNHDGLTEKEKKEEIEISQSVMQESIQEVLKPYEISDSARQELINGEIGRAKKRIADEKAKKYNVVNGQMVRYGILPEILTELLNKRKETNQRLEREKDSFIRAILNALQLAFKVTANSLYGQTGAPTSPIFFLPIAASTTAIGRKRLHYAKKMVEENFSGSEVIYGDTDSIFINFHLKDKDGNERTDTSALIETIALCQKAAKLINDNVPKPQSIVYEKTLHPFILVAKKKYVGLLFTKDPEKYFLKSMGIVLKRRDNAPIVKIVVGGIIDHLLKNRDINMAVKYTKDVLRKLMDGKYPIDKFIISKTLKAKYKKPSTIAHKVLADRMTIRDPGNRPQINDRIPFVYIVKDFGKKKKKDILQGDLIEHPEYVIKNGLKIDYLYYLEHQIINPASQILELMMSKRGVEKLFNAYIIEEENKRKGRQNMEKWMDFNTVKTKGSKTAKKPRISLKSPPKKNQVLRKLPYIGNTKKLECQNINKWIINSNAIDSDDWEPSF